MKKNTCLFRGTVQLWSSASSAKQPCKRMLKICADGLFLGSQFFAYSDLLNLSLDKARVHFEYNNDSYGWARSNQLSGGIDVLLTGLLGVAITDATKRDNTAFLESIGVANRYVRYEKLVTFLLLGYVILVGAGFGLGHMWFITAPARFWLLAVVMLSGPILLRWFAKRRYSMATNYLQKRGNLKAK